MNPAPSRRRRSRYAPDSEVRRAFRLARESGLEPKRFKLGADGSIELDSEADPAISARREMEPADADLAAWERQNGLAGDQ